MENLVYPFSCFLSCVIVAGLMFQFMGDRYEKALCKSVGLPDCRRCRCGDSDAGKPETQYMVEYGSKFSGVRHCQLYLL